MIEKILAEFENPEFWVAIAFFLAVLPLIKPAIRSIKEWSKRQADLVRQELDEAAQLRQEAENLYAEYEQHTKNLDKEHADILRSAEQEVVSIQQEADEKLSQKIAAQKKEVQLRIQSIESHTRHDLAQAIMTNVLSKTKEI